LDDHPTAVQKDEPRHDTDHGSVAVEPKELGEGAIPQKVPSQLSTSDSSVASWALPNVEYPTAVQSEGPTQDTDCRLVGVDPKELGVGTTCQEMPSQLSTSGRSVVPVVELPTAVQ
jgi:hypothetical protein